MLDLLFILILLVGMAGFLCSAGDDSDMGKMVTGFISVLSVVAIIVF